jgi:hypothetical protein
MMMRCRGYDRNSLPAGISEGDRIVSVNAGAFVGTLAMVAALLVAACDKERCEPAPQTVRAPDQSADLRKAAEDSVRFSASNPDSVRFRGVQVWPQAAKNQFAVCGQANVFGPTSNTFVLFVAVVTRNDLGDDPTRTFKAEARVGSTVTEATKVYVDTLVRCYESGGPQNIMRGGAAPVPPMPSETSTVLSGPTPTSTGAPTAPAAQPQPSAMGQAPPTSTHASGTVVMRQNGNIRTAPQGETIRVEPQGKELRVFGEAPGGWLQIGDTEANGWVHSSLVQRR